jgi:hypothetical protein
MKDVSTRTVAVSDVVVEPLQWVIIGHKDSWWCWSNTFDKAVVLELLQLISMHLRTGNIGLFNGVMYFNWLYYIVAFSVFYFHFELYGEKQGLSKFNLLTDTRKLKSYNYLNLPSSLLWEEQCCHLSSLGLEHLDTLIYCFDFGYLLSILGNLKIFMQLTFG